MAALDSLSAYVNRATGGNSGAPDVPTVTKTGRIAGAAATAPSASQWHSLWLYEGFHPHGSIPTNAAIPTRDTPGALPFKPPGAGREKFLMSVGITPTVAGTFTLYDRLFHIGGLNGNITSDQTVQGATPSPALTRYTDGDGVFGFAEIYANVGSTARTLTITYTNSAGVTGRTASISFGGAGSNGVSRLFRFPLAQGDTGVRAIEKTNLNAGTGTAGNFGIALGRQIAQMATPVGGLLAGRDFPIGMPGIPAVHSDACLAWMFSAVTTTAPEFTGQLGFVEN